MQNGICRKLQTSLMLKVDVGDALSHAPRRMRCPPAELERGYGAGGEMKSQRTGSIKAGVDED